jgi:hypothetical protein
MAGDCNAGSERCLMPLTTLKNSVVGPSTKTIRANAACHPATVGATRWIPDCWARSGANQPIVAGKAGPQFPWRLTKIRRECGSAKISKTTKSYQRTDNVCLKMASVDRGWGGSCEHHGWGGNRGHHRWDGSRAHPKTESSCQAHYNHSSSFFVTQQG